MMLIYFIYAPISFLHADLAIPYLDVIAKHVSMGQLGHDLLNWVNET